MRAAERLGAPLPTGTLTVYRRAALGDVGDFGRAASITEDAEIGVALLPAGWTGRFIPCSRAPASAPSRCAACAPSAAAGRPSSHRIWLSGARVYHQYHPVHQPPLNVFEDIIRNARIYHRKWGDYPMGRWLEEFAERGLITMAPDGIAVHRHPTPHEIDATRVDGMVLS